MTKTSGHLIDRSTTKFAKSNGGGASNSKDAQTAALASYIADMAGELATLAERSALPMLAHFLSLARVEAEIRSRELGGFNSVQQILRPAIRDAAKRQRLRRAK